MALEVWPFKTKILTENSPLTSIHSSELYFKIHVPYLQPWPFVTVRYQLHSQLHISPQLVTRKPLHWDGIMAYALALTLSVHALLTSLEKTHQ